jgi:hypothetical protein
MSLSMKKNIQIFMALLVAITLFNCASFSKKDFKNDYTKINETNLASFNGKYTIFPLKKYGLQKEFSNTDTLSKYINSYNDITNENLKFDDTKSVLNEQYLIELSIVNNTILNIDLFKNNSSIKKQQINGRIKKDGMFYLDNKFLKCHGMPYLFGGCRNNKRRIAISKNNNLIVNEAVDNSGALLLFIWAGYSYNSAYEFTRIE